MRRSAAQAVAEAVRGLPAEILGDLYSSPVRKADALRELAPLGLPLERWTRARLVVLLGELGMLTDAEDRRELLRMLKRRAVIGVEGLELHELVELVLAEGLKLAAGGHVDCASAPPVARITCADCREYLATLPDESVDAVVCDPPYELDYMASAWDRSGIAYDPIVWREVLRVLKPGGFVVAFGGSRTYHRLGMAIEDAGFEIRDSLLWLYGTGFPASLNLARCLGPAFEGLGTALKPAHEPAILARKPFRGTVAANVLAHGTAGLNVGACRIPREDNKSNWPANVMHDGSEPVLAGLDSAARFFYCAKVSKAEREEGLDERFDVASAGELTGGRAEGSDGLKSPRAGAGRTSGGRRNIHPTVKPIALMRWLIRLVTPPGGIVLDPFAGSGSTGCAAVLEDRPFLGCELSPEYAAIARARIEHRRKKHT